VVKLFGAKLRCAKCIGLYLVPVVCFKSLYSKLIGSVRRERKYAETGGDQAFLVVVP
jgi:hypothetical protein